MLKLDFTNETDVKIPRQFFMRILKKFYNVLRGKIEKTLNGGIGEIALILISDKRIKKLNREYRKINKPTDVIAFAYLDEQNFTLKNIEAAAGDIFISAATAKKQAKELEHSFKRELEILFIHGLLHLFGFEHKTKKQEKIMEEWASRVLKI